MADQPSSISSADASPEILPRKRTRLNGRESSGCLPCRRRRKRCDDAKPCCKNCKAQGLECKWQKKATRKYAASWVDAEMDRRSHRGQSLPSPDQLTEFDAIVNNNDHRSDAGIVRPAESRSSHENDKAHLKVPVGDVQSRAFEESQEQPADQAEPVRPRVSDSEQPSLKHHDVGFPGKGLEHPQNSPEGTMLASRRAESMDCDYQEDRVDSQTELQKARRPDQPQSVPHTVSEDLYTNYTGQSLARNDAQGGPGRIYQVRERLRSERDVAQDRHGEQYVGERAPHPISTGAFQVFDATTNPERKAQSKKPLGSQREPQLQIRTQTFYPSQYNTLGRHTQAQSLPGPRLLAPTSHPVPFPHPSNKTKMVKGQMYDHSDPELVYDRMRCRFQLSRFNSSGITSVEDRRQLLKTSLGSFGEGAEIEAPFRCEYGYNIKIGSGTYIGPECLIEDPSIVSIGSRCIIGPRVTICCKKSSPNVNDHDGGRSLFYGPGIWIEDRVCIEAGVIIHAGVRIGTGSTIVAGSVVTKSIRERSLAGGNPATPFQYL